MGIHQENAQLLKSVMIRKQNVVMIQKKLAVVLETLALAVLMENSAALMGLRNGVVKKMQSVVTVKAGVLK